MNRIVPLLLAVIALVGCTDLSDRPADGGAPQDAQTPPDACAGDGGCMSEPECAEPGSVADGDPCRCAEDCVPGALCATEEDSDYAGGQCFRPCSPDAPECSEGRGCWSYPAVVQAQACGLTSCEDDDDCGAAQYCLEGQCCFRGQCLQPCERHADCGRGRVCEEEFCWPRCVSDDDCDNGTCNRYTGQCDEVDERKGGLEDTCLRNEDCRSGLCDTRSNFCRTDCPPGLEEACPEQALCTPVRTVGGLQANVCLKACERDADCQLPGFSCLSSGGLDICAPASEEDEACEGDGSQEDMAACTCNAQCASGSCSAENANGWAGGACIRDCTEPSDCGEGYVCSDAGYCKLECSQESDCRPGWACSYGDCTPVCQADEECESGNCDRYRGRCLPPRSDELGSVQAECSDNDACRSGICGETVGCLSPCSTERQGCPEEARCVSGDAEAGTLGLCFLTCEADEDCPEGLSCGLESSSSSVSVCGP